MLNFQLAIQFLLLLKLVIMIFADDLIEELFKNNKIGNYEIYNIDYENAIRILYNALNEKKYFIELIKEKYTDYDSIEQILNKNENEQINTNISVFKDLEQKLVTKYNNTLPEELLILLRDKEEYIKNCYSHYKRGNYVDFPNNMILDLNYNKSTRIDILNKLKSFL
jgi:hypothetical protein